MTEHRLARRAAILKTARAMIAEHGYEAITVRDLAQACRVSVPTLYNQFGGKDQLLAAAIEDHFVGDPDQARIKTETTGLERINATLDFITSQFLSAPRFHRRMLEAFASLESTTQVQESITVSLAEEIAQELDFMRDRNQLADWIEIQMLATQITSAFVASTVIWAHGDTGENLLSEAVAYSTGLVMLGAVTEKVKPDVQNRVKAAQSVLQQHSTTPVARKASNTRLDSKPTPEVAN